MRRHTVAAGLIVLSGTAMSIGSLLSFIEVDVGLFPGLSQSFRGLNTDDGKIILGIGVALIVIGALFWRSSSIPIRQVLAGLAAAGAAFVVYASIADIIKVEKGLAESLAAETGVSAEQAQAQLEQIDLRADPGIGLYLALLGGVLGIISGVLGLAKEPGPVMPAAPPPPAPPPPMEPTGP